MFWASIILDPVSYILLVDYARAHKMHFFSVDVSVRNNSIRISRPTVNDVRHSTLTAVLFGASANCEKATVNFVTAVCLHGTIRLSHWTDIYEIRYSSIFRKSG